MHWADMLYILQVLHMATAEPVILLWLSYSLLMFKWDTGVLCISFFRKLMKIFSTVRLISEFPNEIDDEESEQHTTKDT